MPYNTPPEEVDHALNLLMALNDTLQTYIDTHGPLNRDVMISCGELCALAVAQVGFDANATPEHFAITLDGVLEALKESAHWNLNQFRQGLSPLVR